jgi:hypothetical protein
MDPGAHDALCHHEPADTFHAGLYRLYAEIEMEIYSPRERQDSVRTLFGRPMRIDLPAPPPPNPGVIATVAGTVAAELIQRTSEVGTARTT